MNISVIGRNLKVYNYRSSDVQVIVENAWVEALINDIPIEEFIKVYGVEAILKKMNPVEVENLMKTVI